MKNKHEYKLDICVAKCKNDEEIPINNDKELIDGFSNNIDVPNTSLTIFTANNRYVYESNKLNVP